MRPTSNASSGPGFSFSHTRSGPSEGRYSAPLWEQALLTLWFYVTFISRANDEFLLYPLALYFTAAFVLHRVWTVPLALRSGLLFMLPILAVLSMSWSSVPNAALKFGMMWVLGIMIAVYIAGRFAPHEIIRALFVAGLVTVIMVTPEMGDFGRRGPWGEKNIFAVRMVVVLLAALATAFNRHEHFYLRLLAAPLIPICFIYIVIAQSATSLVFGLFSILGMTMVWLFWSRFSAIRHLRTSFVFIIAFAVLIGLLVLANMSETSLFETFLGLVGKDATLTGRTMLWDAADRIMIERPWLGVGAEGFWLWGRGDAFTLLEMLHKTAGTKFSFHNSYLEIQIHFGRVGLVMLYLVVAWCLWRTTLEWFATQSIVRSFFLLITAIIFISTFTESWMYSVFDTGVTLFYVAAISTLVRREALAFGAAAEEEAIAMASRPEQSPYGLASGE